MDMDTETKANGGESNWYHIETVFRSMKKQKSQKRLLSILMLYWMCSPASLSTSSTSATPETARWAASLPSSLQATQHADEDEDLYDPFPLNE